jgi:hypothetical protein
MPRAKRHPNLAARDSFIALTLRAGVCLFLVAMAIAVLPRLMHISGSPHGTIAATSTDAQQNPRQ